MMRTITALGHVVHGARRLAVLSSISVVALFAACSDGGYVLVTGENSTTRVYRQVERLGNPLVGEVFFPKRDHPLHNVTGPETDVTKGFRNKVIAFTDAFDRGPIIGNTLAVVLVPDMLVVFPNRPASSAGWLSWALVNGYGGRRLQDDVVDSVLNAIFGNLLDRQAAVLPGLTSDNVSMSTRRFGRTFPYLESAR